MRLQDLYKTYHYFHYGPSYWRHTGFKAASTAQGKIYTCLPFQNDSHSHSQLTRMI